MSFRPWNLTTQIQPQISQAPSRAVPGWQNNMPPQLPFNWTPGLSMNAQAQLLGRGMPYMTSGGFAPPEMSPPVNFGKFRSTNLKVPGLL